MILKPILKNQNFFKMKNNVSKKVFFNEKIEFCFKKKL